MQLDSVPRSLTLTHLALLPLWPCARTTELCWPIPKVAAKRLYFLPLASSVNAILLRLLILGIRLLTWVAASAYTLSTPSTSALLLILAIHLNIGNHTLGHFSMALSPFQQGRMLVRGAALRARAHQCAPAALRSNSVGRAIMAATTLVRWASTKKAWHLCCFFLMPLLISFTQCLFTM